MAWTENGVRMYVNRWGQTMPTKGPAVRSVEERFWEKVNKEADGGCWEWNGATSFGYGEIYWAPKEEGGTVVRFAHIVAYELLIGPVPEGLELDHECDNTICVRPAPGHVQPKTHRENIQRAKDKNCTWWRR